MIKIHHLCCTVNRTKYFRLLLSDEVNKERAGEQLRKIKRVL